MLLLTVSCTKTAEFETVYELGSPQAAEGLSFPAAGGTLPCTVYADGRCRISLGEEWMYFPDSPASRETELDGDGSFSVAAMENTREERSGDIVLTRGNRTVKIRVRQSGVPVISNLRLFKAFSNRICFEWDDISQSSDPLERSYQIEVYRDEAMTDLYISAYSYNGCSKDEAAFDGNPSTAVFGKTGSKANAFPTRASVGSLSPSTNYWIRVRSVDGTAVDNYTNSSKVTLHNTAGTSLWSAPLAVSTLPARVPSGKEVIFQGFDSFTVGADWTCYAAGVGPKIPDLKAYPVNLSSYNGQWGMYGLYSYSSMRILKWGIVERCPGGTDAYLDAASVSYAGYTRANYVDKDGWHYDGNVGMLMGQLHLCDMSKPSDAGVFFGTPPLNDRLTDEAVPCRVSLGAFVTGANYSGDAERELKLVVYHPSTSVMEEGVTVKVPVKYTDSGAYSATYTFDTSFSTVSADLSLKKGDVVMVTNQTGANRIIVDDFLIEVK